MPAGACEAAHSVAACAVGTTVVGPSDALIDVNSAPGTLKSAKHDHVSSSRFTGGLHLS